MIELISTGTLSKSLAVKCETRDDKSEVVVCTLGLVDVFVDRDQLDKLLSMAVGWSTGALYDEAGAPRAPMALTPHRGEWTASGVISNGTPKVERAASIKLRDAEVSALALDLTKLGALAALKLTWDAVGDEVEDLTDLLGRECRLTLALSDGGQQDLLRGAA